MQAKRIGQTVIGVPAPACQGLNEEVCWMLQRLRDKRENEGGFTLIELLVVVLIIAILAAIAIPVFLNQREKAYKADVQSTLRNAATAAESYATGNDANPGSYAGFGASSDLTDVRASSTQTLSATDTATTYCITVVDSRLAGDAWGTATFSSASGKPVSADTC
jgi:type IV pilus assembly protein PilA